MRNVNAGAQGERWFVLYNYLIQNTGKERVATRKQILDHLESKGFHISVNTFYADISMLQGDVFGLAIEFNQKKNGYFVKNTPFEPHELRLMIDSIQSAKFITQKTANELTDKIKNLANAETRKTLNRPAIVSDRIKKMDESVLKGADIIHHAISHNCKISFRYFHLTPKRDEEKKYSRAGDKITVNPFALVWDNGNYYLYAYEEEKKKFKTYRIDRMDHIALGEKGRAGIDEYNQKDIISQHTTVFDMFHGKDYLVKLHCHNHITDAIIDRFGTKHTLIPTDNEHFDISVHVELSPPFFAWVATFGHSIKIESPQEAVDGMKKFLQKSCDMYKNDAEN